MTLIPLALFWLVAPLPQVAWGEIALSIERDPYTSSDTVTLCRVRVENHGRQTWPGRALVFEARAYDGGRIVARQRGRFGLSLGPHEILETLVALPGIHHRFEVIPAGSGSDSEFQKGRHGRSRSGSGKRRRSGGRGKRHR